MKKIKGPAIFLAQFIGDKEPFNSLPSICKWVSDLGYKGIQLPAENLAVFDLDKAASSKDYWLQCILLMTHSLMVLLLMK